MYYTYVLKSEKDSKYYVGWTGNLRERVSQHNTGRVQSTRDRRPFQLIYYEACINRDKAISREKFFKSGFGRRYLKNRI